MIFHYFAQGGKQEGASIDKIRHEMSPLRITEEDENSSKIEIESTTTSSKQQMTTYNMLRGNQIEITRQNVGIITTC